MRGNAWQITAIIAIILVVVLIVPLVIMGRNHQTLVDQAAQAKKNQDESARKAATLEGEAKTLKTLIGNPDAAALDDLMKQYTDIMGKAQPGENDSAKSYYNTLTILLGDLEKERGEHRKTSEEKSQLEADFDNAKNKYEAVVAKVKDDLKKSEDIRGNDQKKFLLAKQDYDQRLSAAQEKQNEGLAKAEKEKNEISERAQQLAGSNKEISETNTLLASQLEDVRNPNVEYPAGKIISVDQQAGLATVNLGSADGLLVRTMFSVYHSSITGLSFRTAAVGREPVYCDVCKRDIALNVCKASVEVMRILSPHRAEVRILDDILTDPIAVGDIVYSPIWKPGQKQRFALTAGMVLPGAGTGAGYEAVKHLIESNGGIVDCWIDEGAIPKDATGKIEYLQGSIDDLTTYIVVNGEGTGELEPELAKVQEELLEKARNKAIRKISLSDLLSRMGWKNVTPVYTFGSQTFTEEMRVIPQQQGTIRSSEGKVSPMFAPDNHSARINSRDATPVRDSTGVVSPLFSDKAPVSPASSGKTSDLFRPRKPATASNQD